MRLPSSTLAKIRRSRGYTQAEAASILGVSPRVLSAIEVHRRWPRLTPEQTVKAQWLYGTTVEEMAKDNGWEGCYERSA